MHRITSLCVVVAAGLMPTVFAQVNPRIEVYPPAPGRASALWKVEVVSPSGPMDAGAMEYSRLSVDPRFHGGTFPSVHWATIGINSETSVLITRLTSPYGGLFEVIVLPKRHGIQPTVDESALTIKLNVKVGQKLYIELNGDTADTLFLFVNPLKRGLIPTAPGVHYFGPGVHSLGVDWTPPSGTHTLFIDGGAWVIGSLNITHTAPSAKWFRVLGPGTISGEFTTHEIVVSNPSFAQQYLNTLIHTDLNPTVTPTHDIIIDGPTLIASPFYNIRIPTSSGARTLINTHVLSPWTYNTDGFGIGGRSSIRDCFVFNNDDTILSEDTSSGSISVQNCVLGGRNSFLLGYGSGIGGIGHMASSSGIDLIVQDNYTPFHGVLDGGFFSFLISKDQDQSYRNIVIEGDCHRLFSITVERVPWGWTQGDPSQPLYGHIDGILFENIELTGVQTNKSRILGDSPLGTIGSTERPIVFRNVTIDGVRVTSLNYTDYFELNSFATVDFQ